MRRRPYPDLPAGTSLRRDPALVPLSQDHHHALVHSLRLREAGAGPAEGVPAVGRAFLDHWHEAMRGHFADEEEVLFPALEASDPGGVERLRAEHAEIALLVARLAAALDAGDDPREPMAEIGWLVHDHVRFEERALFEGAQARLSADALAEVGRALEAHRSARGLAPGCPPRTA
jgi:hypothetical protein